MKYLIGIIIVAVVIIGGWYYYSSSQTASAPTSQDEIGAVAPDLASNPSPTAPTDTAAVPAVPASAGTTVTYTANGFSPQTVTIKKGESVTFVDQGTGKMWVASAMHPDHTAYSGTTRSEHCPDTIGTAFDQCSTGSTYTFKFDKTGTWKYHNHVMTNSFGSVVVTE